MNFQTPDLGPAGFSEKQINNIVDAARLACRKKSDDDDADIETASSGDGKEIDPDFRSRKHVKRERASASHGDAKESDPHSRTRERVTREYASAKHDVEDPSESEGDGEYVDADAEDGFEHEDSNEEPDEELESEEESASSDGSAPLAEGPIPKSSGRTVEANRIRKSGNQVAAKHPSLPKLGSPKGAAKRVVKKRRRHVYGTGASKKSKHRYSAG